MRRPDWLSRNVLVLCGVSFLQDSASELLYPVLPIFLTSVLGAPPAVVGAVEGAAEATASLTKVVSGRAADRMSRPRLIAGGYGLAALGKLLIALATVWPLVLAARCLDRVGKGLRGAPRDALLVDGVPVAQRGRVFGLHRAADTAGAVAGPLLGLALLELFGHRLRPLFWVAVLPALGSVALVAALRGTSAAGRAGPVPGADLRDAAPGADDPPDAAPGVADLPDAAPGVADADGAAPGVADPRDAAPGAADAGDRPSARRQLPPEYRRLLVLLVAFNLINFPDALLLLRARQLGLSTAAVVGAYAVYNLSYAALSYPAGSLVDRIPHRVVYAAGLLFFAIGYAGLGLIGRPWLVFLILPAYGGFAACTDGVGKAWVSTLTPADQQGRAQGLYQGLTGAAILVAGLWAGLLWGSSGRGPLLLAGVAALPLGVLILLRRGSGRPSEQLGPVRP